MLRIETTRRRGPAPRDQSQLARLRRGRTFSHDRGRPVKPFAPWCDGAFISEVYVMGLKPPAVPPRKPGPRPACHRRCSGARCSYRQSCALLQAIRGHPFWELGSRPRNQPRDPTNVVRVARSPTQSRRHYGRFGLVELGTKRLLGIWPRRAPTCGRKLPQGLSPFCFDRNCAEAADWESGPPPRR